MMSDPRIQIGNQCFEYMGFLYMKKKKATQVGRIVVIQILSHCIKKKNHVKGTLAHSVI